MEATPCRGTFGDKIASSPQTLFHHYGGGTMITRKSLQLMLVSAMLLSSLASTAAAPLASVCGTSYTVQWGDTLGKIAVRCGTNTAALQLANPSIGNGNWIYAGQVLALPGAYYDNGNGY